MSFKLQFRFFFAWIFSVHLLAGSITTSQAAELGLASQPLFLGTQIDPNIFFMLDDSGSMDWEILTVDYAYFRNYWTSGDNTSFQRDGNFRMNTDNGLCTSTETNNYLYDTNINTDNKYGAGTSGDSGSDNCNRGQMEDHPEGYDFDWRVRSAEMNIMYYNPSATYRPWQGFSDANFTAVRSNPQVGTDGYGLVRNLTGFEYDVWIDNLGFDNDSTGAIPNGTSSVTDGANGLVDLWDSHTTYKVRSSNVRAEYLTTTFASVDGASDSTCDGDDARDTRQYEDCFGTSRSTARIEDTGGDVDPFGRTVLEIKQNVANWYQYHRRRSFVAKSAIATVVSSNTSFRFGLSLLNNDETLFVEVPGELVEEYESHNQDLLDEMFEFEWTASGTPLRSGLERVGRYYSNQLNGKTDPIISACQQNYSVLFTDGYWSGNDNLQTNAIENTDQDGDGSKYTVADVAKYYYDTDLSNLPNDVPTSAIDQNEAQHMVTFTVAFGVEGNLTDQDSNRIPDTDYSGTLGTEVTESSGWHDGTHSNADSFNDAEKIDDVWHAAFNSKGYFVSAQSTDGVAQAISSALLEIADRVGSAASVATNTGSLNAGSKLFQARFDSSDWKGQLLAFQINLDGSIDGFPEWEAGSILNATNYDTGREIITYNPNIDNPPGGVVEGGGVPFRFPTSYNSPSSTAEMNSDQIANLLTNAPNAANTAVVSEIAENQTFGIDIVNYLRGDDTNEDFGQEFRVRNSILGDIVNSDPNFVDVPDGRYPDDLEAKSYNSFVTANAARQGVVYVGANDGMLHGFDDDTGAELIAYIPSAVYKNLDDLASPDYEHFYFVDGGPNIIDVFLDDTPDPGGGNGVWRTVLAGGLNGGGQQIYALDVTEPSAFDEVRADDIVLWEFDDSDDADLGYTYGRPQMAKMADGTWAAIFGNGYNNTEADGNASSTGHGVLFIVDVETGETLKKIDTNSGSVGTPNGLATPLLVDSNGDSIVDYIYAGDLRGDLWKFDVTDLNPNQWKVAGGATPRPLFTTDADQPITSQPQATFHPDNLEGFMIFVGTGKYLEINDNDGFGQATQAFYGVWDKNVSNFTTIATSSLLSQSITNQFTQSFDTDNDGSNDEDFILRDVSDNLIDWDVHLGWSFDLQPEKIENTANASNFGERQVSNAVVRNGRVIFTTLIPSTVECEFGGTSFLMELDFRDGSALEFPAFDLNGDGEYDADDTDASGRASDVGIMPTVSILADGAQDVAFGSGASGDIDVIQLSVGTQAYGRQSWRQLE
ncbi:MAG: type IV pilus assembly protein PilY1 [Pseudohongiellaceae bacterium]|jgi:type IV pilus assembly protein PilY1